MGEARPSPSSSPCGDGFTCIMFLGVHGIVSLQVDERKSPLKPKGKKGDDVGGTLEESLGQPLQITALPLSAIGRGDGASVTEIVSPAGLGYSVVGSENSQFAQYIEAFIGMVECERTPCLTGSNIAAFFNSFDDKMYSYFDSRFNKQLQELQTRLVARFPPDPADFEKFDFTKNFVTFASDEMLKHDFNSRMQVNRVSAGLYWTAHNDAHNDASWIAEKLYCPGTHANQCCLYFPAPPPVLRDKLASIVDSRRQRQRRQPHEIPMNITNDDNDDASALCYGVSIEFSSVDKVVLTITFENDSGDGGFVKNKLWKGIPLNTFFLRIKRYLNDMFNGVEGFDLNGLMSRTCVIDTACANFSVSVRGQRVSIISVDNEAMGVGEGMAEASPVVSMVLDVHNDPSFEMGWWERNINLSSGTGAGAGAGAAYTHSRHRLLIPRDLVSYVPSCLVCDETIKSVEPIIDETTGKLSVLYTYRNGRKETFVREPPSSSGAAAVAAVGPPSDSMGAVCDPESQQRKELDGEEGGEEQGGGGGRKPLHTTRRVRSLRNKSKTKRSNKIRGFRRRGVRRTKRKRTRRTLRR